MSTQNKKNQRIWNIALVVLFVAVASGIYFFVNNQQVKFGKKDNKIPLNTNDETTKIVGCTRTTRLENNPVYDRALSLIQEKYSIWEKGGLSNYGSYYFFPSQLVNCIKVVEGDVKNTTEAEGYFIFNDTEIKDNYFPITVDKNYSDADEITNALLLVHEITHVRQYLDSLNNKEQLSCIDKEVEAFDATFGFARFQYDENRKSIDLRIQYDQNLNPQLQTLKAISDHYSSNLVSLTELCKGESQSDTCSDRITASRRQKIKEVISKEDGYIEQCELQ